MTAKNRATLIGKLHTALKKHFKPAPPSPGRPLMEHVLYASLLEDTPTDLADEGFAKCEQDFFDWNEVRVTTVTELAEVLSRLPSPTDASIRLKRNLQSMFEAFYNFDIDYLKKENLGKAVAKFEAMPGMSPFVLSYLVQHGLGGHAIPIDKSAMKLMWLTGIVSDTEAESGKVPGLERTIPKNRSIEFSSLLHQAGVAFQHNSKDKAVWDVLLSVNKDAKAIFDRPAALPRAKESKKVSLTKAAPPAVVTPPKAAPATKKPGYKQPIAAPEIAAKLGDSSKTKPASEKKTALKTTSESSSRKAGAKGEKSKPFNVKAPVAKSPTDSKPVAGKTTPTTPAAAKSAAVKPALKKVGGEKPLATKPAAAKPPAKTEPAKKDNSSVTSHSSAKASAKASEDTAKKPPSKKSEPAKPISAKSMAAKPLSGKTPSKPDPKKPDSPKLTSEKKSVASTNKKLTKQKPR